ncbi:MAG: autotransporter domain-containing protein [Rhodospirillaceae bacterium]|nr:autotransporter domain-containing protein [Rhodospirillaceae bacterium]
MLKKFLCSSVAGAALMMAAGAANAGTLYLARMNAANEVPPNPSTATGVGVLILNDARTQAIVRATHNVVPTTVTIGHIHQGPAGVAAAVIFPLPNPQSGFADLIWNAPPLVPLDNAGLYFNIHSQSRPGGEIRGQIFRVRLAPSAKNATQTAIANALDVSAGFARDLDDALVLANLAGADAQAKALDDLSGRSLYIIGRESLESMANASNSLLGRAEDMRFAGNAPSTGTSVFANAGVEFGRRSVEAAEVGSKISRPFVVAGFDFAMDGNSHGGLALGYAQGKNNIKNNLGTIEGDTTSVQGFFSSDLGGSGLALDGVVGYGRNDIDTERNIPTFTQRAVGGTKAKTWSVALRASSQVKLSEDAIFQPYLLLDHQSADIDGYSESGAGSLGLIVSDHKRKNTKGEIGGAFATSGKSGSTTVTARLTAGLQHRLSGGDTAITTRLVGSAVTFATPILAPAKSAGRIGASITAAMNDGLIASFGYRGLVGSKRYGNHAVELRMSMGF